MSEMIKDLRWHSLQELRAMSRLTLLYKKVHGLVDVNPSEVVNSGRATRRSTSPPHHFRNIIVPTQLRLSGPNWHKRSTL